MDEPLSKTRTDREKKAVFALAALILMGIVSLSFYNLDRHPAYMTPSDQFVERVDELEPNLIFATDPVALAALERNQHRLDATVRPLTTWPPRGTVFTFGPAPNYFEREGFEHLADEAVWSLWRSPDSPDTPRFEAAVVEVVNPDGTTRRCPPDVDGGHQCGRAAWSRVRWREIPVDGESQRCIWAHPLEGKTIRVRFPNPPSGDSNEGQLWLQTALHDDSLGTGVPVDFTVRVDDTSLDHHQPDRRGWYEREIPIDDGAEELAVEVSARNVGRRHTCFRFELR